ncbi:methyltransferase [Mesorhizobium sp. NBSH29]|uniref:tRNA1(Val) (adenine(37)-N6)-methyltransferase n=1 Tax=Mesorhizobium sp. NBSH29 TaxID=2654249 RepID=UPI0018965590|nr:methyltransferase [Mesorhizobium sp. NBSH29]QPC86979.1 methyltransferase [Mesorhizobium sp. NBSH29]
MAHPSETIDGFQKGRFFVVQPLGKGHRTGMDALVLAATVPAEFGGNLADFGSGAGAAGLAVASRCPRATIVLVERELEMAHFAAATLALAQNSHLRERSRFLRADVALTGMARIAAGLVDNSFDFVIMNPPFNQRDDRLTPDRLRQAAHVMNDTTFEHWLRSAAAVVKPSGSVALIARPQSLAKILTALEGRFGGAEIVPVQPHAQAPAIRIIVRAKRGSRAKLALMPPLVIHEENGTYSNRADAVVNGEVSLFGD